MNTTYYLIDKTKTYQTIYQSNSLEEILHEFLSQISSFIDLLHNSKLKFSANELRFDHLQCLEMITTTQKPHPFIVNAYNFDIVNLCFNGKCGNKVDVNQYHRLDYVMDELGLKLNIDVLTKTELSNKSSDIISNKPSLKIVRPMENKESPKRPQLIRPMESKIIEKPSVHNNVTVIDDDNKNDTDDLEINETTDPEVLKKTIESLNQMRNRTQDQLNILKKTAEEKQETYSNCANQLGDIKRILVRNKEREEERRKKFSANLDAYHRIKADIDSGKFTEDRIPDLFINEYPIYKFMDQNNLLDNENDYNVFINIYNQMYQNKDITKTGYVPHNINYLNEDEKNKYEQTIQNQDAIDDFVNQKNPIKKIPSIDDTIKTVNNDKELNFDNVDFGI